MLTPQPGILSPLPKAARFLSLVARPGAELGDALRALARHVDGERIVLGVGAPLAAALGRSIDGLHAMPAIAGARVDIPSTPADLWLWLRGEDRGELMLRGRTLEQLLAPAFALAHVADAFVHGSGRDLTGYEDGTENPQDDAAVSAAIVAKSAGALAGSSFVAVQQWLHDFSAFEAMRPRQQDLAIGRERESNEEIDDAPPSAHVKRTAQESFAPEAFVLRRSMPWIEGERAGLHFVAFGASFGAFEAQLRRMSGAEDGVVDALFSFTRPVTGAYFWCPPMREGRIELTALGL
ncbi:Dyp-type peroxidase [Niveibacterium umoris]|uniref:Putative iron-dependent peroxidase n=1 Tax=Niveibacterium umoris TaxID=1193620 RepID=A0A840BI02_9RHOO|nr:Dyp-type peroxidase [Niveibacterium umoris]MBB4011229.1 putative iron-dependent peroxidase [Niveibacterium umoris]